VCTSEPLWRAHGERIHVQGDVAVHDTQCMIDVLDSVRVRVAPVDGVLHLAGLADLKYVAQVRGVFFLTRFGRFT